MKSSRFALLEVDPLVGDGEYNPPGARTFPRWESLLELLNERGVRSVSQLGLMCGGIAWDVGPAAMFVLRDSDEAVAAALARICHGSVSGFVWSVASGRATADWSNLVGAGVICASAGVTGRPLVGLGVGELRQELAESRESLHDVLGYAPMVCCPRRDRNGIAVDGLVAREAERAGYRMILQPGRGLEVPETTRLSVYTPATSASVEDLADWIRGDPWLRIRFALTPPRRRWFA